MQNENAKDVTKRLGDQMMQSERGFPLPSNFNIAHPHIGVSMLHKLCFAVANKSVTNKTFLVKVSNQL